MVLATRPALELGPSKHSDKNEINIFVFWEKKYKMENFLSAKDKLKEFLSCETAHIGLILSC